jgi:nucleotide-binding universal stress UspA family protein
MFNKIVVPLDGSKCAGEALEVALSLAKNDSAEIAVCSIVDPIVVFGTAPPSRAADLLLADREIESRRLVDMAIAKARLAGVKASGQMHLGVPYDEILRFAKAQKADAIVMGTHGRGGLKRLFLGSVAESVLHGAACPVIVVHESSPKAVHA